MGMSEREKILEVMEEALDEAEYAQGELEAALDRVRDQMRKLQEMG